jgi:hypothetical protein
MYNVKVVATFRDSGDSTTVYERDFTDEGLATIIPSLPIVLRHLGYEIKGSSIAQQIDERETLLSMVGATSAGRRTYLDVRVTELGESFVTELLNSLTKSVKGDTHVYTQPIASTSESNSS